MMLEQALFITAELRVKADKNLHTAINAIHTFCAAMKNEPGCSMATVFQDKSDPYRFILWEQYDNEAAFQQHFNAKHTQAFIEMGLTDLVQVFELNKLLKEV
ncbi:putative quinol monooxygenase [Shewanella surugensis]|uniref:Antibiotic biosynthesis monooxygenase n=1 Tax=Shewanella surugensis TaxID=212020 RepID=A0ABT0LDS5_9GAMM|nr:antibiotic biosynthesis monooxygenase [Shewanella surugensis]MCL1125861.1 antibiotic biosynthesis monooxygenase [Shewanella surugensis]